MTMMKISEFLEKHMAERQKVLTWTRCMGYYRDVTSFNVGKKSEFKQRAFYKIKDK